MELILIILNKHSRNARLYTKLKTEELILPIPLKQLGKKKKRGKQ